MADKLTDISGIGFNPTRVRLKLSVTFDEPFAVTPLQPHEGTSETRGLDPVA